MNITKNIPVSRLHPNDYNPNEMTEQESKELLAEVLHLGRLPKPVVVRPSGDGFTIVDGEHAWRAAKDADLTEIPCEIIEVDEFEARRQTYKRNQHGTHDPVRLGQMFRQMMECRDLSQRKLAEAISVSEGTVRNMLLYADAAALRNGYAFGELSVRQVRAYLSLPDGIRDTWLASGPSLEKLDKAACCNVELGGKKCDTDFGIEGFHELAKRGLDVAIDMDDFVASSHRAFNLLSMLMEWRDVVDLHKYVQPIAELGLPPGTIDICPCKIATDCSEVRFLLEPDKWADILQTCDGRTTNAEERAAMIRASARTALRRAGIDTDNSCDPRTIELFEIVKDAPDFIRDSNLSLFDKARLATMEAADDVVLRAKGSTVGALLARDGWFSGEIADDAELTKQLQEVWRGRTVESIFESNLDDAMREHGESRRDALLADREKCTDALIKHFVQAYLIREGTVAGRLAAEVLREQIAELAEPMFKLLACSVLYPNCSSGVWFNAVDGKHPE